MCLEEEGLDDFEGSEENCVLLCTRTPTRLPALTISDGAGINVYGKRYAQTEGLDA